MKKFLLITFIILVFSGLAIAKEEYPFSGQVSANNINVRAGANINFEVLCKLVQNEKVTVIAKSYDWYKIILPKEAVVYIHQKYVRIGEEPTKGEIAANRVNIRAKPGDKFSIIGQANKGQRVNVLKKTGDWVAIEPTENTFGWVNEKFIRYHSQINKEESVISRTEVTVLEAGPKAQQQKAAQEESLVTVVGTVLPMGKFFNRQGTHKLVSGKKTLCILRGDRIKLDSLINYRVKVVGTKSNTPSSKYPVIVVKELIPLE